jgi:CheY-like chemotaxis protein
MKVLVIEDDPTDRKLMVAVLQMDGHHVRESMSAESALGMIAAEKPDVVLLDLRLPGMDGPALVRQLKAAAATSRIPVVAVTAYPERYAREELVAAGCEACIVKPVDTRELTNQIVEVELRKSR